MLWVQECLINGQGTEVSGLMKIEQVRREIPGVNSDILDTHIVDAVLLPQACSSGYTEMTEEGLAAFMLPLMQKDEHVAWSGWWHSHNDFGTFFSGIDQATAIRHQFPVSVVFNRYGQMYGQFNVGVWERECLVVTRPLDLDSADRKQARLDIATNVKELVYVKPGKTKRYFRSGKDGVLEYFPDRGRRGRELRGADLGEDGTWFD